MILDVITQLNEVWQKILPYVQMIGSSAIVSGAVVAVEKGIISKLFASKTESISDTLSQMETNVLTTLSNSTINVNIKPLVEKQIKTLVSNIETSTTTALEEIQKANLERQAKRDKLLIDMASIFTNAYGVSDELKSTLTTDIEDLENLASEQEAETTSASLTIDVDTTTNTSDEDTTDTTTEETSVER